MITPPQRDAAYAVRPSAVPGLDENILMGSVIEALETMAFTSAEPPEAPSLYQDAGTPFRVSVAFNGTFCGVLQLDAPRALGECLATTLFCSEPGDPEMAMHAEDSLSELGNVICGLLLRKLSAAVGGHFELHVPEWAPEPASPEWNVLAAIPGTIALCVERLPLLARIVPCPKAGVLCRNS